MQTLLTKVTITDLQFCWISDEPTSEIIAQCDALLGAISVCETMYPLQKYLSLKQSESNPQVLLCEIMNNNKFPLVCLQYNFSNSFFFGKIIDKDLYSQFISRFNKAIGIGIDTQQDFPLNFLDPCLSDSFFSKLRNENIYIDDTIKVSFIALLSFLKNRGACSDIKDYNVRAGKLTDLVESICFHTPTINIEKSEGDGLLLTKTSVPYVFPTYSQTNANI
jgi:hypothetical protein